MKKIGHCWPILVAIVLGMLNVDWIIIPSLRVWGLSNIKVLMVALTVACTETFYWYWFWGWIGEKITELKAIHSTIDLGKDIVHELQQDRYFKSRYFHRILKHFLSQFEWATHPDNWIFRAVKYGGYGTLIFLGLLVPGGRVGGVICCRIFKWKIGFAVLMVADLSHVVYMVFGWNWLLSFLGL